jgi:hypothetical protein
VRLGERAADARGLGQTGRDGRHGERRREVENGCV